MLIKLAYYTDIRPTPVEGARSRLRGSGCNVVLLRIVFDFFLPPSELLGSCIISSTHCLQPRVSQDALRITSRRVSSQRCDQLRCDGVTKLATTELLEVSQSFLNLQHSTFLFSHRILVCLGLAKQGIPFLCGPLEIPNLTTTNELTVVHVIRHRELALEPHLGIVSCDLARRGTADVALLVFDLRTRLSDKAFLNADLVRCDHHLESLP